MADKLSEIQRNQIETEIFAGRKIQAIKLYRAATNDGLKEAKEAVEAMDDALRLSAPERFSAGASKSGCMGMVVGMVLLMGLLVYRLA